MGRLLPRRDAKDMGLDAVDGAKKAVALGAGEIVLNSIDADGTKAGFDLVITRRVSESVRRARRRQRRAGRHQRTHGRSAARRQSRRRPRRQHCFHFGTYTVGDREEFLAEKNISVRL